MKTDDRSIWWFEKEDGRKRMRLSIGLDGKLRLGKNLRQALPADIRLGFDYKTKTVILADGHGGGIDWPKCGILAASRLSSVIARTGLTLPVAFQMDYDAATARWLGRPVLRRQRTAKSGEGPWYDTEQIFVLFQHLIDNVIHRLAKSMPLSERRAIATEELCAAARSYRPGYGDMEAYFSRRIERRLLAENQPYTASYTDRSLDQPLPSEDGDDFCLYDMVPGGGDGGISAVEARIDMERFVAGLAPQERDMVLLLGQGYRFLEIGRHLHMEEAEVREMGESIQRKRREYERAS